MADIQMGESSNGPVASALSHIKTIRFALGKGNKSDGKLIVVAKGALSDSAQSGLVGTIRVSDKKRAPAFIKDVLLSEQFLGTKLPKVLISVTGAAADFNLDPKLEQVFAKGLVNAAKSTTAWIVSGGTDVGVMHFVGEANRKFVTDVPTIGFATYNMINNKQVLKIDGKIVDYDPTAASVPGKTVNLNANHTHFVLIESTVNNWGEEIEARSDFEEYMAITHGLPLCLIVVNGGPGTLRTVAEGAMRKFSVVLFEGTGRAADAIAREIRRKRKLPYEHLETMNLNPEQLGYMNAIVENSENVKLYSVDDGPFDLEILKAILLSSYGSLQKKLELAVEWDRVDLAQHLLEAAHKDGNNPISPEEFNLVLSKALEASLDMEKPNLFRLFSEKGARKTDIDLAVLYTEENENGEVKVDELISRYAPHLPSSHKAYSAVRSTVRYVKVAQDTPLLNSGQKAPTSNDAKLRPVDVRFIKAIFSSIDPIFYPYSKTLKPKLLPTGKLGETSELSKKEKERELKEEQELPDSVYKVKFTDAMLWAILTGKLELAKVIWEKTALPVHAALIASGLCKGVGRWLLNEQDSFLETAKWFEEVACELLDKMDYEGAKTLLTFDWPEFKHDTLQIAVGTECKDFLANSHVQRYLDELLYSDDKGGIPPGTSGLSVILCIFLPFLLNTSKTYENNENSGGKWYHFYGLPYTKFWTTTLCYIGYLVLLAIVMVGYQGSSDINSAEYILWVWMFGYAIEEVGQLQEEGWSYFRYKSNQMDIFILILQVFYVSLAIASAVTDSSSVLQGSTDILIVATIISYVRLMDVFSISKELGPLYVVLTKIISDVFKWIFVFLLFALGFQISFMALNQQAAQDNSASASSQETPGPWVPTINGGSFMGAFFTIIGDWDSTMQVLKVTSFGAIVVSLYALIAQIMLVNLLIAMMGDTFNSVKENSDREWRFSRYSLIVEYTSSSFHPPPFNIIILPIKRLIYFFQHQTTPVLPVTLEEMTQAKALIQKQRDQFKNLMKDAKEAYLEDKEKDAQRTIEAVGDAVRESFKTLIEEQAFKHKIVEQKLSDLVKLQSQSVSLNSASVAAASSSSASTSTSDLKMEINYVQENVNSVVKQEISALQKTLLDVIKTIQVQPQQQPHQPQRALSQSQQQALFPPTLSQSQQSDSLNIRIQENEIPLTWAATVKADQIQKLVNEYRPFRDWINSMNKPANAEHTKLKGIHVQVIDMFGPRIGFVKFAANIVNESGQFVPGIVFMRGGAVAILIVLRLEDTGKEYTILTVQPRVPIGDARFPEIPAGMLDGEGHFAGVAAKELREETGLDIKTEDLIDLTGLAYDKSYPGIYPSAGGCDEFMRLFLYRTTVSKEQLDSFQNKLTGIVEEGENICLKVIPLDELWLQAPDAKALSALCLYNVLTAKGTIPKDY